MKTFKYYIAAFAVLLLAACDMSDPGGPVELRLGGGGEGGSNPEANARIAELNEGYSLLIQYEFEEALFAWNWTQMVPVDGMPYTPADPDYVVPVLDFLENKVFSAFPEGFIANNLQPMILLVGDLQRPFRWGWEKYDEPPNFSRQVFQNLYGNVTRTALILAGVNSDFDPNDESLREAWISMIVERIVGPTLTFNTAAAWSGLQDFVLVTNPSRNVGTTVLNPHWVNGDVVNPSSYSLTANEPPGVFAYWPDEGPNKQWWNVIPVPDEHANFPWWRQGVLKPGRLGFTGTSWWSRAEEYIFWGILIPAVDAPAITKARPSIGQDLGDFYVFITTKTAAQKAAFYNSILTGPGSTNMINATTSGTGGQASIDLINQKIPLAKQVFLENFGFTPVEPN
ncbi:MAG: hypothetical protein FWE10_02085 [Rikenellaceae bacterium]|nr:hypothetical protein [Rikenellaceae bacterium]MCL2692004.1 hypothetical protein [Rikenellaceae bacterium]